jgi:hypothetical protein
LLAAAVLIRPGQTGAYQHRDSSGVLRASASAPPAEQEIDINHASMNELLNCSRHPT